MTTRRARFLENARRLVEALGDPIPAEPGPACAEVCERAERGQLHRDARGDWTQFNFEKFDWSCQSTGNPPVMSMYVQRFHVLVPLASMYRKTRDDRHARTARKYIDAFIRDHAMNDAWAPGEGDGPTQYDLRVGTTENAGWLGTMPVFLESPVYDDEFFERVVDACRVQVNYLAGHVYPDRNIRLMHSEALILNSIRLDFLPEAARWRELGVRVLSDAVARQVLPDGAHKEAVPGYHGGVMNILTNMWRLSAKMPGLGLHIPAERVAAMHDYALATTRPDGRMESLHDTGYSAARAPESHHVRAERARFRKLAGLDDSLPTATQVFPVAGQAYLRDDWTPDATFLTFDATERRSFHWHPCRNAITLYANRRQLLIDTGYPFSNAEFPGSYGSRTAHHSTLNLNGWNQTSSIARQRVRGAPGYDLIEGLYDGGYFPQEKFSYGEGIYGEHYRAVLWLRGRCLIVLDQLYTTSDEGKKPTFESVWQLSEGGVRLDEKNRLAATTHDDGNLLMLFPLTPEGTKMTVHSGDRDPMRGWIPVEWGKRYAPAPMVRLSTPNYDPWTGHYATVLVPFDAAQPPTIAAAATPPDMGFGGRGAGRLDLRWPDGSTDQVVWIRKLENAINQQQGLDTDASLVHLRRDPSGKLQGGLAVDAHYLRTADEPAVELIDRVARV